MSFVGDMIGGMFGGSGGGGSGGINMDFSKSRSDSSQQSKSGPYAGAKPALDLLYSQAANTYNKGYTPYEGDWHAGENPTTKRLLEQYSQPSSGGQNDIMKLILQSAFNPYNKE